MKVRMSKPWERLPPSQKKTISEEMRQILLRQEEKDMRIMLDLYIKMACVTLHDAFGFGEKRLNMFLGNHKRLFHRQRKMVKDGSQVEYLNRRMAEIFKKGGFPQSFFDGMLGELPGERVEMSKDELLISGAKSNNSEIMRNKQVEEMAEHLIEIQQNFNEYCAKPCRECELGGIVNCENHYKAESLYNAGYRKQSEWISVEERLPEEGGTYLVVLKEKHECEKEWNYHVDVASFTFEWDCIFHDWDEGQGIEITHWMPLPEPPKKGGE